MMENIGDDDDDSDDDDSYSQESESSSSSDSSEDESETPKISKREMLGEKKTEKAEQSVHAKKEEPNESKCPVPTVIPSFVGK